MNRVVEPEILETLADDHPDAVQSRADLLKVNWIMGNHAWMLRTLKREKNTASKSVSSVLAMEL